MKVAEELKAARDELLAAIKPAIESYQKRTGLRVDEIAVEHPAIYQIGTPYSLEISEIKVRTNASSL